MSTQQGLRHTSWRAISGTAGSIYNSDAMAAMKVELEAAAIAVPATFNGRMIAWLQNRLGSSATNINDLRAEWAAAEAAHGPSSIGSFDPSAYVANPVNFDGANDFLTRGADLTGNADSKLLSGSFWTRITSTDGTRQLLSSTANAVAVNKTFNSDNVQVFAADEATNTALNVTLADGFAINTWVHLAWSVDLGNINNRAFFMNGVAASPTWTAYNDAQINFTLDNWAFGGSTTGSSLLAADIADVWLAPGVYLPMDENIGLFIQDGRPQDPSNWPLSLIQFYGPTDTWHINKGTGGGFTENGALTDGTGPVELSS